MSGTFKYFSYGSNLLERRILANNPTAKKVAIGKLMNYRLDFNHWSRRWKGNAATIVPDNSKHVWGMIWEIGDHNKTDLDRQEGVDTGVYEVLAVEVVIPSGSTIMCRTYMLCDLPSHSPCPHLPPERYPSKIYLDIIIQGAINGGLPKYYIEFLKKIPHNDFDGPVDFYN